MGVHEDTLKGLEEMLAYIKGDTSQCRERVRHENDELMARSKEKRTNPPKKDEAQPNYTR